ncbi:MAG TPA: hypothetical protein GX702_14625 [Chloroflexi bacterium]|nr:hypothetical protein [Chloroflexota bacterium]
MAGLLAALLVALAPMAIYHSREAKGYPYVTFFGLLALYLSLPGRYPDTIIIPTKPRRAGCGRSVLAGVLAPGSHYYVVFLILAQAFWLAIWWVTTRPEWPVARRLLIPWAIAQGAITAILAPWFILTLDTALIGAQCRHGL